MLGMIREHWPTYHYKSGFNGRFGDLAVRPVCLHPPSRMERIRRCVCAI